MILPTSHQLLGILCLNQKPFIKERAVKSEFTKKTLHITEAEAIVAREEALLRRLTSAIKDALMLRLATIRALDTIYP